MINRLIILLLLLSFYSCTKNEFVFIIERPNDKELDGTPITLYIDNKYVYHKKLQFTNIASIYDETSFNADYNEYTLKVEIADTIFEYSISYPNDKYIIISPNFKDGRVLNGILKSSKKYNLH